MSGYSETYTGSFVGTGAALNIERGSFRPTHIHIVGGDGSEAHWFASMADDTMIKRLANGTGSAVTSGGITPTDDGFTLGNDGFNSSGRVYHYLMTK
jgi:hypothetical protein